MLIEDRFDVIVCLTTISDYTHGFRYTFKRINPVAQAAVTPALEEERRLYSLWVLDQAAANVPLIYLDEVGFKVSMRKTYERSLAGQKAVRRVPSLRSRNISVIAAMGKDGILHWKVLNGNCNAEKFTVSVNELAIARDGINLGLNTTLIMDNLSAHKTGLVRARMEEQHFHFHYLPAYSPFHNPIEMLFAQWRNHIRTLEPQNEEELMAGIENFALLAGQAANYVTHAHRNAIRHLQGLPMVN